MKLAHHYRILGLRRSASFGEVKKAYRQLVRKYHPDINPDKAAIDRFIKINAAYTALCEALQPDADTSKSPHPVVETAAKTSSQASSQASSTSPPSDRLNLHELKLKLEKLGLGNFQQSDRTQATTAASGENAPSAPSPKSTPPQKSGNHGKTVERQPVTASTASDPELTLKQEAYNQLKDLLRQQKFPRAIALVEGLAHRLPADLEINQWRAIVYQRWGRQLISQGQFKKARLYLKKALQTDPNNPSLSKEVARDLGLLKHLQAAEATL